MARRDQSAQATKDTHRQTETSTLNLQFDTLRLDSHSLGIYLREVIVSRHRKEQRQHNNLILRRRDTLSTHHARDQTREQTESTGSTTEKNTHHRAKLWLIIAAIAALALWRTYHNNK